MQSKWRGRILVVIAALLVGVMLAAGFTSHLDPLIRLVGRGFGVRGEQFYRVTMLGVLVAPMVRAQAMVEMAFRPPQKA